MIALRYALLTGSDMSVINSGPKRNNYSDHSSYSYSGIGPKNAPLISQALWEMSYRDEGIYR